MSRELIAVVSLLSIALAACLFVMWVIVFRLRSFLISTSYKFIFAAKLCWAVLCAAGIYLILWPLPRRIAVVQFAWFSLLALGCILSAIGFYLYSRDVRAVLQSDDYLKPLPAVPAEASSADTSKIS